MEIKNSFEVPLSPDEAWKVLMDVPRIAPCMPGAELTEVVGERSYKGKVSVRLGPVALAFAGIANFEDVDDVQKTARLKAQGSDSKGRGGAEATVRFHLESAANGTRVNVVTNVSLSGAVAQYGRGAGLIQSVATQLVGQFAECLSAMLAQDKTADVPAVAAGGTPAAAAHSEASYTPPQSKPISGLSLVFGAIWQTLRGLLGKKQT